MLKDVMVSDLFRLDAIEGIRRRKVSGIPFYLFRPYDLLKEDQELAFNSSGILRLYVHNVAVAETHLEAREGRLFLALAISYPCQVESYQMLALHHMQCSIVVKGNLERAHQEQRQDEVMQPVNDLMAACNRKIRPLGIRIHRVSGYVLTSDQQEPEQVIAQGGAHYAHID